MKIGTQAIITDQLTINNYELIINRGYTSHEHFNEVGIIHMNGRLYDPLLRRFLNADENIQDPNNTQNYNKYGYVMNNPLMYNDPNGEFFVFLGLGVFFWKAVIIGAAVGLASYTIGLATTENLDKWNIGGALKATLYGAISGAATFGIGSLFASSSGIFVEIGRGLLHGFTQGILSYVQGENFASGFFSAALGSLAAYGYGNAFKNFAGKKAGQILFGALAGGVGAELTGGNFWQGAITGIMVSGLNHVAHSTFESFLDDDQNPIKNQQKKEPWDLNGDGKLQKNEADNWWLNGKGQTVNVDNSKIDWRGLEMPLNKPIGSNFSIETHVAFEDLPYETAATYGGTSFQRTGYREAKVLDQKYHYDYRPNNSAKNVIRNFMNWAGKPSGQGVDYMIHYLNPTIKFK